MTSTYADGTMPTALRGTPFTDKEFEKASKSWTDLQRKIKENPKGRGGKSVRSGDLSSTYSKRTAAVADLGSDEEDDSGQDDQDVESFADESRDEDK